MCENHQRLRPVGIRGVGFICPASGGFNDVANERLFWMIGVAAAVTD